ncbi:hypothetical protein KAT80_00340 [Candidatus Pacearchaeota archaeon]|nr:hypothetical protein [Candidatus Pacearchaeota archaeon]
MKNKKGVSPVIATVLLIAMVVVIGLIIFLWFRGLNEDAITKFGKNVELVCGDVSFSADYDSYSGRLSIVNDGNVNIFNMNIKIFKSGSHETKDLRENFNGWPKAGLNQGEATSMYVDFGSGVEKIILIPVLAGKSEKGDRTFVCKEKDGREISLT